MDTALWFRHLLCPANLKQLLSLWICFEVFNSVSCHVLLHTFDDIVSAESYSYFHITQPGRHQVEVISVKGDADVYVSDKSTYPTFVDYELKSTTCGRDLIDIPASFSRPVVIGVYGHPNYVNTTFMLNVYYVHGEESDDYESFVTRYDSNGEFSSDGETSRPDAHFQSSRKKEDGEDESPWMTLLIGILKIILDILF